MFKILTNNSVKFWSAVTCHRFFVQSDLSLCFKTYLQRSGNSLREKGSFELVATAKSQLHSSYVKLALMISILAFILPIYSFASYQEIADKIWKNECGGKVEGLTHWNKGEDFASLGIGHFIWYVEGKNDRFEETFPKVLAFIGLEKAPLWLKEAKGCPWISREDFYQNINSVKMKELKSFLLQTKEKQAEFMVKRLDKSFKEILIKVDPITKNKIQKAYDKVIKEPLGPYVLVDYLNFKGSGLAENERYKGYGWGLLQVLQEMEIEGIAATKSFAESAKKVLIRRVQNSPKDRGEDRWLKGWLNRINTY